MTIVHVEAQLSPEELLKAVSQLSLPELDQLVFRAMALLAQRKAPALPSAEAELLLQINQGLSLDELRRYDELIGKRQATTLTPEEYADLLQLTDQVEALEARRVGLLVKLAQLRQISLTALMEELGIQPLAYV